MTKMNIETKNIFKFLKKVLNKQKVHISDIIFHSDDACNSKVLILTRCSSKNIEKYIDLANIKGIKGIIIDKKISKIFISRNIPVLISPYLNKNLNIFLSELYNYPLKGKKIVGITGTDGKTSMIHMLAQAYKLLGKKVGIISTEGNGIYPNFKKSIYTTPRNDLLYKCFHHFNNKSVDIIIIESSSQGLDQGRLDHINFDVSMITNITRDHLDYHKTHLSYIKSKCILLNQTQKVIFLNKDCKNNKKVQEITSTKAKYKFFDKEYKISGHKSKLLNNTSAKYNFSLLYSVLKYIRITDEDIIKIFEKIKPIPGRNNIFKQKNSAMFIVDYAHTNSAFTSLLDDISKMYKKPSNYLTVVFGCGGDRDIHKRLEMGKTADKYCDYIILTDDNPRNEKSMKIISDISKGISEKHKIINLPNRKLAIKKSIKISSKNDIVIIAGKGNEDTINYNSSIVKHNDIKYLEYLFNEN